MPRNRFQTAYVALLLLDESFTSPICKQKKTRFTQQRVLFTSCFDSTLNVVVLQTWIAIAIKIVNMSKQQ